MDTDKGLAQAMPATRVERRASPPTEYVEFFNKRYRELLKAAMYAGATRHEADEAAAVVMAEVLRRWTELNDPLAYARRAVVSTFVKEKTHNLDRVRRRQVECGAGTPEFGDDPNLTMWEDRQWVGQMLASLPRGQRDVMAFIVDGFAPTEIAALLGRSPGAVRLSLHEARHRLKEALRQERADDQQRGRTAGSSRREAR